MSMQHAENISAEQFFRHRMQIPIIDVRSPGEFCHAHLPGAKNIALFDDKERTLVGTTYKKKGREAAIWQGLELAGPKLSNYIQQVQDMNLENEMYIHCWRGGMRSEAMAWLFQFSGFRCRLIQGGYKACRQFMKTFLKGPFHLIILGGMTGSGKTEILHALKELGEQVIDLESLAHHKGSAFGGIGQTSQPTTEQFENNLFDEWFKLDPGKPIWIEDESKSIGSVTIPDEVFLQMRSNPVVEIQMNRRMRINRLVDGYANLDPEKLQASVLRIQKRLGYQNTRESIEAIKNGNYEKAIDLILNYYDKWYHMGLNRRPAHSRHSVPAQNGTIKQHALQVLDTARHLGIYHHKKMEIHHS